MRDLEKYFQQFRKHIIGIDQEFKTPSGKQKIIYVDWAASGRLFLPIEKKLQDEVGPFVANTHTETSITGALMTQAYHKAQSNIKKHANANKDDIIITAGSGATRLINKFQRILGIKLPDKLRDYVQLTEEDKPVVFISHMEHHSNHTSWLETLANVECIEPNDEGLVNLVHFKQLLEKYKHRKVKILAVTAASNVTGIQPPYHQMAKIIHSYGGYCFVDFACAAPYTDINMHPKDPEEKLDAIYFSPHKFLGGPSSAGVLIFDSMLYTSKVPDNPGGGTVKWTNPWGEYRFFDDIEEREDGGTPAFLQTIRAALCIKLKEKMGVENILAREEELLSVLFSGLLRVNGLHILAANVKHRLGVVSFYIDDIHYNLIAKLLNDRFGIQVRGGCSCAGTYGHFLLHVTKDYSHSITDKIDAGILEDKPGWVRISIHPTTTNNEIKSILFAIEEVAKNHIKWRKEYNYDPHTNEFTHIMQDQTEEDNLLRNWFELTV